MGGAVKANNRKPRPQSNMWTNACYDQACKNLGIPEPGFIVDDMLRKAVSKEYMKLVRQLPTWILSLILDEYDKGIQSRADETIQEILDEISHRTLLLGE